MPTFSVRSVIQWSPRTDQRKKHVYEERITLWNARSLREAIALAEREAKEYAGDDATCLGLLQGYWMFDGCRLRKGGIEVFSLIRESDLPPKAYLKRFFDTGCEREGEDNAEPDAAPNRRQARRSATRTSQRGGGR